MLYSLNKGLHGAGMTKTTHLMFEALACSRRIYEVALGHIYENCIYVAV